MLVSAFLLPFVYLIKLLLNLNFLLGRFSLDMARQFSVLEEKHSQNQAELVRRCSDFEEKYSQSQTELAQVSAALNDANVLNSTLRAQLDSEKVTWKPELCFAVFLLLARCLKKLILVCRKKNVPLLLLVTILTNSNSLTILERSHRFTMEELDNHRCKLQESSDDVIRLRQSISAKDAVIKELCASKKSIT
jgi:hypothetical protein